MSQKDGGGGDGNTWGEFKGTPNRIQNQIASKLEYRNILLYYTVNLQGGAAC